MISAVGSPIGESDAVLAVASAQLVFASKVCYLAHQTLLVA